MATAGGKGAPGTVSHESLQTLAPGGVKTIKLQEQAVGLSPGGTVKFEEGVFGKHNVEGGGVLTYDTNVYFTSRFCSGNKVFQLAWFEKNSSAHFFCC